MAYLPLINVVPQFFDNLGDPLVGGTLNAYVAGTSTPTNMFSDNTGTVAGTSVTLDSRGEPTTIKMIWVDTDVSYKFVLKDSNGSTIWTEDNIQVTSVQDGSITTDKLAVAAVTAVKIASDAVTTAKIADSNVTTAKLANNAVTPAKLQNNGYELGTRNRIINGDMTIAQRGSTFAAASIGYTLDRWRFDRSGAMVCTVSYSTDYPSNTEFNGSLRIVPTTADTSIGAGDYCTIEQRIEGSNIKSLVGKTLTLSFWVRSTLTGKHCVAIQNSTPNRSYVMEYTINASDTWEYKTLTITDGLLSTGTWTWAAVIWTLAGGSTYQTTANAWQTGDFFSTSNQVNLMGNTANIFAITGCQLEAGSAATPFEFVPYDRQLAACQRYYEQGDINTFVFSTSFSTAQPARGFAVTKRLGGATMTATPVSGTGGTLSADTNGFKQTTVHSVVSAIQWTAESEL